MVQLKLKIFVFSCVTGSYKISPKPCTVDTRTGTCMFVWECLKTEGKHLGMCVDGFMFGSCCGHNSSSNFVLDHNSITTTSTSTTTTSTTHVPQETAIYSKFPTSSSTTYRPAPWKITTTITTTETPKTTTTTAATTTTESTKRPHPVLSVGSSSSTGEHSLPFVTANGSSIPDKHYFPSSTLSSAHTHHHLAPSTAALIGNKPPSSVWSTTSKPTTTTTTTTTTTERPTTTRSTSTKSPPLFPTSTNNNRNTPRPTTIFIDPRSTTTPQPNVTLDKDYGCGVAPIYPQMRIVGGKQGESS